MKEQDIRRNILLYRLYTIFNEPLFWGPVLITSLQNLAHLSLSTVYSMEAVVLGLSILLDVPFGALADLIGRKKTMVIGRVFLFASAFFFMSMSRPLEAWIADILWVIGYTLQSGADTALIYDTLDEGGRKSEYKRIEGQAIGLRLGLMAFCSLAVGFMAKINLRLPMQVGLPFVLIPLVASFCMKEPRQTKHYSAQQQVNVLKQGWVFTVRSREVRWMIGFAALIAAISKVWFFTYNPYFELVGVDIGYYGVIFFLLNIVAWLSSHHAQTIEGRLGERSCILVMILCMGMPILCMGLLPIRPFAYLVLVQNIVRGFMPPFVKEYVQRHISADIRATVASFHSSATNLAAVAGMIGFAFLIRDASLPGSLVVLGSLALIAGGLQYRLYKKMTT